MQWRNLYIGLMMSLIGFNVAEASTLQITGIKDIEAVTEVFGDGEHLSAVILTYEKPILSESVSIHDFEVPERTISHVYVNENQTKGENAANGHYVILELEPLPMIEQDMEAHSKEDRDKRESKGFHGPTLGSHGNPKPLPTFSAEVTQTGTVKAVDGTIYPATNKLKSSHTRQLVVEDFIQDIYTDVQQNDAKLIIRAVRPRILMLGM